MVQNLNKSNIKQPSNNFHILKKDKHAQPRKKIEFASQPKLGLQNLNQRSSVK